MFLTPPLILPGAQRSPPDRPKKCIPSVLLGAQNFDRFWTSILVDFGVVLGPSWGVLLGLLGSQDGPKRPRDASRDAVAVKNDDSQLFARLPSEKLIFALPSPQDGTLLGPKIAPRRPKSLSKSDFCPLENRIDFWMFLGVDFGRFWVPDAPPKVGYAPPLVGFLFGSFFLIVIGMSK